MPYACTKHTNRKDFYLALPFGTALRGEKGNVLINYYSRFTRKTEITVYIIFTFLQLAYVVLRL